MAPGTAPEDIVWLSLANPIIAAFIPQHRRDGVTSLWALDAALTGIFAATKEPALRQIRLAWWREAVASCGDGRHDHVPQIAALRQHCMDLIAPAELCALIDDWEPLLVADPHEMAPALEGFCAAYAPRLWSLSARLITPEAVPCGTDHASAALWAQVRHVRCLAPVAVVEDKPLAAARVARPPKPLRMLDSLCRTIRARNFRRAPLKEQLHLFRAGIFG